jgi:hypothetical protein
MNLFMLFLLLITGLWASSETPESINSNWVGGAQLIHPQFGAAIAQKNEAAFTLSIDGSDRKEMIATAPYFQAVLSKQEKDLETKNGSIVLPESTVSSFKVTTGTKLSDFIQQKSWDLSFGIGYYTSQKENLFEGDSIIGVEYGKLDPNKNIIYDLGLKINKMQFFGQVWDDKIFLATLEYYDENSQSFSLEVKSIPGEDYTGWAAGYRKSLLRNWMTLQTQYFMSFVKSDELDRSENKDRSLQFGSEIRFRPFDSEKDPKALRKFISPFDGEKSAAYFYDFSLQIYVKIDLNEDQSSTGLNLTRYF